MQHHRLEPCCNSQLVSGWWTGHTEDGVSRSNMINISQPAILWSFSDGTDSQVQLQAMQSRRQNHNTNRNGIVDIRVTKMKVRNGGVVRGEAIKSTLQPVINCSSTPWKLTSFTCPSSTSKLNNNVHPRPLPPRPLSTHHRTQTLNLPHRPPPRRPTKQTTLHPPTRIRIPLRNPPYPSNEHNSPVWFGRIIRHRFSTKCLVHISCDESCRLYVERMHS